MRSEISGRDAIVRFEQDGSKALYRIGMTSGMVTMGGSAPEDIEGKKEG
jgi:hypothetical protein